MDNNPIMRAEFVEYTKRMEDEHARQNHRLAELEEAIRQNNELTISVKEMAVTMKSMLKEQQSQGDRLQVLEARDGKMWRKAMGYVVSAIIGGVITYMFKAIGM